MPRWAGGPLPVAAVVVFAILAAGLTGHALQAAIWEPAANLLPSAKPRLIVLTDMGADADDAQSLVRLLLYSNEIDIEGILATTSKGQRSEIHPELIEERIRAYGQVAGRLRVHAAGFPDHTTLLARVRAGSTVYGMSGVGNGKETPASRLIIEAVDRPDPRPVWIAIWGGAADLAQAMWTVRASRSAVELERFVAKLRVYSISDQDDAGPWVRATFPRMFWIASIHAFTEYEMATWHGISGQVPGSDPTIVSRQWLQTNIRRKGVLGAAYPQSMFIMEGDTPSFLNLIPNGLSSPGHPDWGGWGGRYRPLADSLGLWTDSQDTVRGADGVEHTSNKATVWRWRPAFQNDFAVRMDWSVASSFADANHPPAVVLNGHSGAEPVEFTVTSGENLTLNVLGSSDPDNHVLKYRWYWYPEVTPLFSPDVRLSSEDGPQTTVLVPRWVQPRNIPLPPFYEVHVIVEVTDDGVPPLTRYRRALIRVQTAGITTSSASTPWWSQAANAVTSSAAYSTAVTDIGTLLDDPAARAVLDKHLPGFSALPQIGKARSMTLRAVANYVSTLNETVLDAIDVDLATVPSRSITPPR